MRYADFEYHAMEYFGFTGDEVAALLDGLQQDGVTIRGVAEDDMEFWSSVSDSAAFDTLLEVSDAWEDYPLDPRFPHDEYLDAGDEWELTAEAAEGYGETT